MKNTWTYVNVFLAVILVPLSAAAYTADEGEIAVIEDIDGSILGAAFLPNVYLANAACAFYLTHQDVYDTLFVFNTSVTNIQQGWTVRSFIDGIGRMPYDSSDSFCAWNHRLRITVSMGNINTLPPNPDDVAAIVPFYPLTGKELMAHEFGHHWMSAVNFDKGDDQGTQCLLRAFEPTGSSGRSRDANTCNGEPSADFNQHWSYNFNSCSLMYGSCIEDLGGGNFRYSYPLDQVKYSQLDQYLMGLRAPEDVDPMFVVYTGDLSGTASIPISHSSTGAEHTGERIDVTIEDIIRENGPRNPAVDTCHWKAAFVLVHPAGQPPLPSQIQQVDTYRRAWETYYDYATDNRGSFDTRLDGCGTGTNTCPGETSPQCGQAVCSEDETRCIDTQTVQICQDGDWTFSETCGSGKICTNGACADSVDGDADGDKDSPFPDGDADNTVDGDEIDGDETDGDDSETDGDSTGEIVCRPGDTRCEDNVFQTCTNQGTLWGKDVACEESQVCHETDGCVVPSSCNPGDMHCADEFTMEVCSGEGTHWNATDCSATGMTCWEGRGCYEAATPPPNESGDCQHGQPPVAGVFLGLLALLAAYRRRIRT